MRSTGIQVNQYTSTTRMPKTNKKYEGGDEYGKPEDSTNQWQRK